MDDDSTEQREPAWRRGWARSAALVGSGVVAGGILVGTLTATAATNEDPAPWPTQEDGRAGDRPGPGAGPPRGDEKALTGDTATSVTDAVLAEYPDATIQRVETDSDGVYEAHIVTTEGERLTVELDESFAITGTETHGDRSGGGPGRGHGPHGHGPGDDGPEDADPTD